MFSKILSDICFHLAQSADAPALITPEGTVTFAGLAARVIAIQSAIAQHGAGTRLILGHKETDCVAAMIACAIAGHPFVFADQSYPVQRINRIVGITGAIQTLVAGKRTGGLVHPVTLLSSLPDASSPAEFIVPPCDDRETLYIIFTSGSSGEPKGVPISRGNYAALHGWYAPLLAGTPFGAHVNHSSFAFDMGMFDLWPTLSLGRPVILLNHNNNVLPHRNILQLRACPQANATSWASTPSLLQLICSDPAFDQSGFPDLRFFVVGGEMLPRPLIREMQRRFPNARLFNGYGPSEATCCTHLRLLTNDDAAGDGPLSLGLPVGPSQMRIVDEDGNDLHAGETGEVLLIGPQVVEGYVPTDHPANRAFGWQDGMRSYRTGDLGRLDVNGALYLLGRIDRQVKWLGNRIELDEIERVAAEASDVNKATCIPQKENGRVTGIVLFLETGPGAPAPREAVLAHLARHLPAAIIPRDLRFVERIPVTTNGKVDAGALLADPAIS